MVRLLFVVALAALVAIAITSLHHAVNSALNPDRRLPAPPAPYRTKVSIMPAVLRNLSYALLVAMMFGIVTGWIGG